MDYRVPPRLRQLPIALAAALAALHATPSLAQDWTLCRAPDAIPAFRELPPEARPRAEAPVNIEALELDVSDENRTVLTGDVELWRADQWLGTDVLVYEHAVERYQAQGEVRYQDDSMRFTAQRMQGDLAADTHELDEVRYQLVTQRGNGEARQVRLRGNIGEMQGASFSTCDPDKRSWELRASDIRVDQDEGMGTARGATIYLGGVPVLYTPWLSFPTDDRRRSGLLYPTVGYDAESGLDLSIPYYLNLAPNYDMTLTPRLLGRRGVMLGTEFRYLTPRHRGTLETTWLPNDRLADRDRASLRLNHVSRLNRHWLGQANVWRFSDREYLEDFSESSHLRAQSQIRSIAGFHGRGQFWDSSISASKFQLTDPLLGENSLQYAQLPRVTFRYQRPLLPWLEAGVRSEAVAFEHPTRVEARRLDLRPWMAAPLEGNAWFVRPELGYRYTAYDIDRATDDSPSRGLPIASLDMGAFFERPANLFGREFINTLEPRLYYLYVPYRDQDNLPVFDSRELTFGYAQLFRDNRFSGADRQGDANQATAAVTTRLLDPGTGREWLNASVGQIRYFTPPRVTLPGQAAPEWSGSDYVVEAELLFNDRWSVRTSQVYSPELSSRTLSAIRGQYRYGNGGLVNLGYRYRRDQLEQTDLSFVQPIRENWRLIGRWNYSILDRSTIEAIGGVEWEGCCLAVRLLGRHYVRNREGEKNNAVYLEIELKGLGSFGRRTGELLERAILDYDR